MGLLLHLAARGPIGYGRKLAISGQACANLNMARSRHSAMDETALTSFTCRLDAGLSHMHAKTWRRRGKPQCRYVAKNKIAREGTPQIPASSPHLRASAWQQQRSEAQIQML
jgi:hypothetical protein